MRFSNLITALLASAFMALSSPVSMAQGIERSADGDSYVVNLRDADIQEFAEQVSGFTGRTLILDPAVSGKVTVISGEPLDADGVWRLFQSVLRVNGYAAVASGGVWRVVPQAQVNESGPAVDTRGASSQDLVTRVVRLDNLPAEAAANVLRPLVASFGYIEALPDSNAIVITDYAENIERVQALAWTLDRGQGAATDTIQLNYAAAADVAETVQRIMGGEGNGAPRIAADERSNVLLVRGDADSVREVRSLVQALDRPGEATAPVTRVIRLNNTDAESVTAVLSGLLGGQNAASNPVAQNLATGNQQIGAGSTNKFDQNRSSVATLQDNPASGRVAQEPANNQGVAFGQSTGGGGGGFTTGDVAIQAAPELNAIVARGSAAAIANIETLVAELDVRRPQVLIEAAIVELTGDVAEQLGVQFGAREAAALDGGLAATSFSNSGPSLAGILRTLGSPAAIGLGEGLNVAVGSEDEFSILVQALATSTKANLLSTPSITTLDNELAEIVVAQNVPFRTGSFVTEGVSSNPFTTIEREDVGLTLRVAPRLYQGDVVRLEVSQEVSSLLNSTVAGAADLITNRRSIQTTVLADNGQTIVLGGLITDDRISSKSQVPILGDIPVIGGLFGSQTQSRTKTTLFVFLRPTILRNRDDVIAATAEKYDRVRDLDRAPDDKRSLLLEPESPKLPLELDGIY